jgi:xanthine dehydrogenase YagT iron-sulfur-binding subunit
MSATLCAAFLKLGVSSVGETEGPTQSRPGRVPDLKSVAKRAQTTVTRRDFLIGAGAGAVTAGVVLGGAVVATRPPEQPAVVGQPQAPLPPAMRRVTLNIDGVDHDVTVEARESLWEVMTHRLGLGSRINLGCDRAMCGTCGVTVDGRSVYGCTALAARLGRGQKILTVHGLAKGPGVAELHPIQKAFLENFGFQCAICSRGFIMSTYALLSKNPNPTEPDVRKALEGNICRCGNYTKIFDSVFAAARAMRG